ncbi:MAG: adenylosuccinate synthase [Bacteroidota bacterium]
MRKADVILGLQWGDEGKGKIVDLLTAEYDIVARYQGGPNAGHTIEINGKRHVLHLIPSGIFHKNTINLVGNGVIIDPYIFNREILGLKDLGINPEGQLLISRRAHLILPTHRMLDACQERMKDSEKIGSTLKGIGPAYTDKVGRTGIRVGEIFSPNFKSHYDKLKNNHIQLMDHYKIPYQEILIDGHPFADYEELWFGAIQDFMKLGFVDSEYYINQAMDNNKSVLAEGAQGALLDIDFGSYPYVTSSSTTTGGVCTGLGIPPNRIGEVIGIFKAYCTRVGNGPFPTELLEETGEKIRVTGHEFGSTTGRPRRCGWIDLPALRYAMMVTGCTQMAMMKSDVLDDFDEIQVCTHYNNGDEHTEVFPYDPAMCGYVPEYKKLKGWKSPITEIQDWDEIPLAFKDYIRYLEKETKIPITLVSLGPGRTQSLRKTSFFS